MTNARNQYTGEVEFVLHEAGVETMQKHLMEWFPGKNMTMTNKTLEIDDVFEEDGRLRMLLLYLEKHGHIEDAYIQIGDHSRIEDVKGELYLCEYENTHTECMSFNKVVLLQSEVENELLQTFTTDKCKQALIAFFALFNAMGTNQEMAM